MTPTLLLLIFGKLQEYIGRDAPAWPWALSFGLCLGLVGLVVVGDEMSPIAATAFGFYCWAYLMFLRRCRGQKVKWMVVYLIGALLPAIVVYSYFSTAHQSF